MAKNPMQRKAQNSFLLGMLVTMLIAGVIIAILILQLTKLTKEKKEEEANLKTVYVLKQDVKSGDSVTSSMLESKTMDGRLIPSNVLTPSSLEDKMNTYDEDGNLVKKTEVISKIALKKGTIVTEEMVAQEKELSKDIRKVEYNMIALPSQLETGKYIDVRLKLPNGTDFIVLSHKKVDIPEFDGVPSLNTISLNMTETEILTLSCAIVEAYKIEGSVLYANEYVEPGLQEAATMTYIPNEDTVVLISKDKNCVAEAANGIIQRYNSEEERNPIRNPIQSGLNENGQETQDNAVSGLQEEVQTMKDERQKYLESLGGSY